MVQRKFFEQKKIFIFLLKTNIKLKKRPKAIIFDWDNTLVNSWPVIADALNYTLETFTYNSPLLCVLRQLKMRPFLQKLYLTCGGSVATVPRELK